MPHLQHDGDVSILYLGDPGGADSENRFHPDWVASVNAILDELEATEGPRALVTTATGKFYSTGADLEWCAANPSSVDAYLGDIQRMLARILTSPLPTVAALQGHTFGAGAFLAIAHDHKVMRSDRGFFCFPGISIGAPYAPGVLALATSRLGARAAREALLTGRRYGGAAAVELGLVEETAEADDVLPRAIEHASGLAHTRGDVLAEIKQQMYSRAVTELHATVSKYDR